MRGLYRRNKHIINIEKPKAKAKLELQKACLSRISIDVMILIAQCELNIKSVYSSEARFLKIIVGGFGRNLASFY